MKIILLLLLFFLNLLSVFGQSFPEQNEIEALIEKGDSLKKTNKAEALSVFRKGLAIALDHKLNDHAAIFYKKIGVLHHRKKTYPEAEQTYRKGLKLDSTSKTAADLYYNISLIKDQLSQRDSAMWYLEKSLKLYDEFESDNSGYKAFLRAGNVYKDRQLYEKALSHAIKAYEGFKKDGNTSKLADACTSIGNIQNQMGNHHQAINYHYQALALETSLDNKLGKGISHTNIANVYDDLKVYDSAIANYEKALGCFDKQSMQYAILLSNIAITYKAIGNKALSKDYFLKSLKAKQAFKDSTLFLYSYNGISSLFLDYGNLKQARVYLDSAGKMLPAVTDKRAVLSSYENEAEYHKKTKQYKTALDYHIKYTDLYQDIYNLEQAEVVQTLQAKFEHERNENKILSLNLANKNAQLLLSEKNESIQYKNLTLVILAVVILLVVVGYQYILQKQKATTQTLKIEKLEAIYDGQETIKKRIARDLHDIITTNFDGLRLRVLALKRTSNLSQSIDGITNDLKKMNQQIRMVSHRLYPLEMYMGKQKFTDIIKSRLSEFQLYGNVFVELEDQLPEALNQLPIGMQNNFYGILLEVLNNIEKHAHATKLHIRNFLDGNGNLNVVFEDNGIGIKNEHKEGIGLMNIKQRVEMLEGTSTICKTNTGTKVHIEFPMQKTS